MTYRAASDAHYAAAAPELQARWGKIDLHAWLAPIARHLHGLPRAAHILDIGAGTGQLSAHLALRGHRVTAVEPVAELWQEHAVSRIQDDLPRLGLINGPFDLVLGLSVLHHLPPADQRRALGRMADLTAPGGALILAARHGPGPGPVWPIHVRDLRARGLRRMSKQRRGSIQPANRKAHVKWTWLVLAKRPAGVTA